MSPQGLFSYWLKNIFVAFLFKETALNVPGRRMVYELVRSGCGTVNRQPGRGHTVVVRTVFLPNEPPLSY